MANLDVTTIRNVALLGHEHTGKTTLVEAFLEHAGIIKKAGSIKEKNTVSDFDSDEKEHLKSHFMSTISFPYSGKLFNLLDVPGSPDSIGDVLTALRAVESAVICVDATAQAVLVNTRRVWKEAEKLKIPRVVSINRLDASNTNYKNKLAQVQESFSEKCIPIYLPNGSAESFTGVFNVLKLQEGASDELKEMNTKLIEAIVESDEAVMEKYLEGAKISEEELSKTLVNAVLKGELFPVFFTSAEKEIGTKELLETLADYAPDPTVKEQKAFKGEEEAILDPDNGFVGLVFRTMADEFVTRISQIRIVSGKMLPNSSFINRRSGATEKIGAIFRMRGKDHEDLAEAGAGEIVGIAKVGNMMAGDTITDEKTDVRLPEIKFPVPMVSLAVKPKTRSDEQKIGTALREMEGDDMTFHFHHDEQTGDLLIRGMSDNHLKLILTRLKRKRKVEVETSVPHIPYKETITKNVKYVDYTHKKQSGGAGQFAKVFIDLEPLPRGGGYDFVDKIVGGVIDNVYRPSVDKGIQSKMAEGIIAGYPVVDIKVTLVDGKTHPVDSKDIAFQVAGREAIKKAFMQCSPVLLEPLVKMDVMVPQDNMGDIMGDLNSRRGKIASSGLEGSMAVVSALVPLAEIQSYQADLKSITGGEGSYSIEFDHYDIVPSNIQAGIIETHLKEMEEAEK